MIEAKPCDIREEWDAYDIILIELNTASMYHICLVNSFILHLECRYLPSDSCGSCGFLSPFRALEIVLNAIIKRRMRMRPEHARMMVAVLGFTLFFVLLQHGGIGQSSARKVYTIPVAGTVESTSKNPFKSSHDSRSFLSRSKIMVSSASTRASIRDNP